MLVPFQLGIVAWYFLYWDRFPKYSLRQLLPWLILFLSGIGVPFAQIWIYRRITSLGRIDDPYLGITIFAQSAMAIALAFYLLVKRRRASRESN